jgi:uncharacterized caspase-like protein
MKRALGRLVALIGIACCAAASVAKAQETRVALVIGNSHYAAVSRLRNPPGDVAAVAQALREVGFRTVRVESDLGSDAMRRVLRDFAGEAEKADWAIVYYAGHGVEVSGTNYLIPVDARLRSDRDVQFEAVALDQVLASIEGARRLRLVILDACRDNPFLQQMTRTAGSRSIGRGLARVEPEGGTLVAYAAKAGQIAFDGEGQNSPFVSSLIKRLGEPGVEINMLFRAVRDDVLLATGKKQEPFVYGSLPNEAFYFKPSASLGPLQPMEARPAAPPSEARPAPTVRSSPSLEPKAAVPSQTRRSPTAKSRVTANEIQSLPKPPKPRAEPRAAAPRSGRCFSFNGRSFCE